ncbi:hypothetical protein RHA1_ro03956 [Rhodococcus jostii RHA1]|uniref:Uncharacterized protein n=1 Tax=Rhodococcus jostii (strain RHA1) TaxID=101510 RepID=Q0S9N3_RHOJR|nr:hypothetical protein RHA1_ro03956 [Rhodococcus jostii RHA1]
MDEVDAVDVDAVEFGGEFQDRRTVAVPLLDVVETGAVEDGQGGAEVREDLRLPFLRSEHGGGGEHGVVRDQGVEGGEVAMVDDVVPAVDDAGAGR